MTVIEAICCGLPLVVAKVPSMEELSEGNALFFPAGDEKALGEQLLEIAENEELHKELSKASRRLADRFEGARVAEQFEALYRSALEKKGIDCE